MTVKGLSLLSGASHRFAHGVDPDAAALRSSMGIRPTTTPTCGAGYDNGVSLLASLAKESSPRSDSAGIAGWLRELWLG